MRTNDQRAQMVPLLQAAEEQLLKELEETQVTHPLDLYQPGSERLEKLYAAMALAQKYSWPSFISENV